MGRVVFLDHLHTRPAVLGYLVDVGTFESAQACVGVAPEIMGAARAFLVGG